MPGWWCGNSKTEVAVKGWFRDSSKYFRKPTFLKPKRGREPPLSRILDWECCLVWVFAGGVWKRKVETFAVHFRFCLYGNPKRPMWANVFFPLIVTTFIGTLVKSDSSRKVHRPQVILLCDFPYSSLAIRARLWFWESSWAGTKSGLARTVSRKLLASPKADGNNTV